LIEIVPGVEFYNYEAKYTRDDTKYIIDPPLPPGVKDQCVKIAMTAFQQLCCRDIARVDIMLEENNSRPQFLEINTMPGFTTHSLVPMAARATGLEMPELCARLVERALVWRESRLSGRASQDRAHAKPKAALGHSQAAARR